MDESGKKKRSKKMSLTMSELIGLADAKGTVTPARPGMVSDTPVVQSPAGANSTPKRLAYTPRCSVIASPSMDA